jgi:hypothetical protein
MEEKMSPTVSPESVDEVVQLGDEIYRSKVQSLVEPQYDGQYVGIHVDSGDYEVAKTTGNIMRAMLKRHSADGRIYLRKIGNEPEYALAARILAGRMMAGQMK